MSHFVDHRMFFNRVVNEFADDHVVPIRKDRTWGRQLSHPRAAIGSAATQRHL
jgi:hypothetical protein